ncbi:hypothetical protein VSH64_27705 [Amycolatopsis rhabdoformis]|uniref:Uncharacterized protein n=1 Tax=Amycolatopsis rhabdoformis TaxID=1448059 RepID=A0ABZ1HXT3_9PSEU|nr:hypothetical protein [Amycolatopsis rhabdoformis]WSE26664.1 hypothetical protein VSH64_27705 [Amycolatopsis rhabdoformis]
MTEDLPSLLRKWHSENIVMLTQKEAKVEVFDSAVRRAKNSFGVAVEFASRISYLTVWDSGEAQIAKMDLDVDAAPNEEYREYLAGDDMLRVADSLVDWVLA